MTIEEFNKIPFAGGMTAVCKGKEYPIVSCDLVDKMIAIQMGALLVWVSYKKIKNINARNE